MSVDFLYIFNLYLWAILKFISWNQNITVRSRSSFSNNEKETCTDSTEAFYSTKVALCHLIVL